MLLDHKINKYYISKLVVKGTVDTTLNSEDYLPKATKI